MNPAGKHEIGIVIEGGIWLDRYFVGDVDRTSPETPVPIHSDLHSRAQEQRRDLRCEALLLTQQNKGMAFFTEEGEDSHFSADAVELFDASGQVRR